MSFESAKKYLSDRGFGDKVITFEVSTATVELAAKALNTQECRSAKTLGFIVKDTPILIVMAGDVRVDNKKYKQVFHEKAHMLSYESSVELIGHAPGGVCPGTSTAAKGPRSQVPACLSINFWLLKEWCGSSHRGAVVNESD